MKNQGPHAERPEERDGGGGAPGNDSPLTVIIAFIVNFLVAGAKTVAAFLTGSASMTAEAAHS